MPAVNIWFKIAETHPIIFCLELVLPEHFLEQRCRAVCPVVQHIHRRVLIGIVVYFLPLGDERIRQEGKTIKSVTHDGSRPHRRQTRTYASGFHESPTNAHPQR